MGYLENKTIVIMGGSSAIGFAVAEACLKAGTACLVIVSPDSSLVEKSIHTLKQAVTNVADNVIRGYTVDANDAEALKTFAINLGDIDHIVWATGDGIAFKFLNGAAETKSSFDAGNFWGPVAFAQNAKFKAGGSLMITIGSLELESSHTCAAATMGAVDAVSRSFAVNLAPVRVNLICAGLTNIELWKGVPSAAMGTTAETNTEDAAKSLPLQHIAGLEEIVEMHVFVMKSMCITGTAYFAGQKIEID